MTTDALSFLADSPVRARLIDALRRDGPARPSDLTATLDVSRATIHRNLSALTDRGWVRQESDGYDATTAGELVYERFDAFRTGVETVDRFERLLEIIPASGVPPLSVLATADLVTAEPDKPHAPSSCSCPWSNISRRRRRQSAGCRRSGARCSTTDTSNCWKPASTRHW